MHSGLREVMRAFPTGVTVLSTPGADGHGMTANAFTSVSLEPPLVLVCVSRTSRIQTAIDRSGVFGVSILGAGQATAARWFADSGRPPGSVQFASVDHWLGSITGAPLLTDAIAWLECRVHTAHDGGDHQIVVAEVMAAGTSLYGDTALVFSRGQFTSHEFPLPRPVA